MEVLGIILIVIQTYIYLMQKMIDQNNIVIVGGTDTQLTNIEYGKSTVSNDGGLTWSTPNQFAPHDIVGVDFYNNQIGYCVGGINSVWFFNPNAVGSLWQTSDGGYNWTLVDSSYSDLLSDIQVVNDSLAYAVGFDGTILKNATHYTSLGLNSNDFIQNISIFPNPFNTNLTIQLPYSQPKAIEIIVFDITGRVITQEALNSTNQKIVLNSETWSDGVYFIQMKLSNSIIVKKAIKQK
ncbi:MAG: T9SS type A sorting domain-containing protein [Bacteroidetes bacterium]|nr:T9SS type A sorting domain-containing protein [Bacteroidota bacterium]